MQAKDIPNVAFMEAAYEVHKRGGTPTKQAVWLVLCERWPDLPYKIVMAKMGKLNKQRIMEGCECNCGSPMWLVDGKHEHSGLNRLVDWYDDAWVQRVLAARQEQQ